MTDWKALETVGRRGKTRGALAAAGFDSPRLTKVTLKTTRIMKAIRVSVSFSEWLKVEDFLSQFRSEEDTFTYMVDNTTFIAVTDGECTMAYFKAQLETVFEDEPIIVELK